ncbi:hypothetical protein ACTMKN_12335 [Bacteroides pyogenes]|uniref:hypothetical protein n=1 Tax=Bacteroides pyogenes TaxID=310300 RepID=UPI0011E3CD04|nr:hypothetical protein [Bacteroides pyogenes]TYK38351.1 hypothetical protein FNJ59_08855 [Bacteroides pyogenes]
MNKIEELVYHAVSGNPTLKNFIRNTYQALFDMLPRKKEILPSHISSVTGCHFGFHDCSTVSPDDTKLLVVKTSFDLRMPRPNESAEIGYYEINSIEEIGSYHKIDDTLSWNWHKGSREQWINNETVIFNTFINGSLCSKSVNISTGKSIVHAYPIDSISPDGKIATTFSYERLELCMPGYGYPYQDDSYLNEEAPKGTGLYIFDLISGERKLIVSINDLLKTLPIEYHKGYTHFITHTEFSPDGRFVCFMHRWTQPTGNILKRRERLIVYELATKSFIELPSGLTASHYAWNNKHQIIASVVLDGKCCHALFDIHDIKHTRIIAGDVLNTDGHQSFINDNEFITDTYPDKRRNVSIYRVNIEKNKATLLARVYSPKKFQTKDNKCHIACDLHPRMSYSKKYYSFDSPRTGKRSVYLVRL